MGCYDKNRHRCGGKQYAICTKFEASIPEFTTLEDPLCASIEDVGIDLYALVGGIKEEIDLSEVTSDCQTLPTPIDVKTYIQFLLDRDCAQQLQIDALIAQNIIFAEQILALQQNICP